MSAEPVNFELDLRFVGGAALVRPLGVLARQYREDGVPPPPRPTVGQIDGVDLPLLYPGLNGLAGPAGTGKSLLTKAQLRQVGKVVVLDCETSEKEYVSTLMGDFGMSPEALDQAAYVTDSRGEDDPARRRWSGHASLSENPDHLIQVLAEVDHDADLVIIDSQSKSMAVQGLDENRPMDCEQWYQSVAEPVRDRWPKAAVVLIQGRQKGWHVGQDVRQGRGSSSMLHEVVSQFMLWTRVQGGRNTDGLVDVVCTKDRYGHRIEGQTAAQWHYGPSGFFLTAPPDVARPMSPDEVRQAWLDYLEEDPRDADPRHAHLPPKRVDAVKAVRVVLGADQQVVDKALDALIKAGEVHCEKLQQSIGGVIPQRVWSGDSDGWTWD